MSERRRLRRDLFGVKGWFRGGECVDHITIGTEFTLARNDKGKTCLFAYGREYPLNMSLLHDVMERSEPLRGGTRR